MTQRALSPRQALWAITDHISKFGTQEQRVHVSDNFAVDRKYIGEISKYIQDGGYTIGIGKGNKKALQTGTFDIQYYNCDESFIYEIYDELGLQ